jgi:hypothetical protein
MSDLLRIVSPAVMALAAGLIASRKRLVRHFERAEAFDSTAAVQLPSRRPFQGWWLARLTSSQVLRPGEDGRYWVDQRAWRAYRAVRRRRALLLIAAVLLLWAGYLVVHAVGR